MPVEKKQAIFYSDWRTCDTIKKAVNHGNGQPRSVNRVGAQLTSLIKNILASKTVYSK